MDVQLEQLRWAVSARNAAWWAAAASIAGVFANAAVVIAAFAVAWWQLRAQRRDRAVSETALYAAAAKSGLSIFDRLYEANNLLSRGQFTEELSPVFSELEAHRTACAVLAQTADHFLKHELHDPDLVRALLVAKEDALVFVEAFDVGARLPDPERVRGTFAAMSGKRSAPLLNDARSVLIAHFDKQPPPPWWR